MKNNVIALVLIPVVLAIFAGIYFFQKNQELSNLPAETTSTTSTITSETTTTTNKSTTSTIASETTTTDIPFSYTLELDVRIPKDSYQVGQSLVGAEYYLKYEGEPFKAMILYSESVEGLIKKSYSTTRGTIQTGDFDNPETLPGLKISMYSVQPDGTPNPFDCDGNYVYSISVYDCVSIDNALGTDDCGEGGWPPSIEVEDIVTEVSPLKIASKRILVVC